MSLQNNEMSNLPLKLQIFMYIPSKNIKCLYKWFSYLFKNVNDKKLDEIIKSVLSIIF